MCSLLTLVQLKVNLPLICPILRDPHNLIRQEIVFFTQQSSNSDSSNSQSSMSSSHVPADPRRSKRSTKGTPHVHFGKVYSHSTIISEVAKTTKYKLTL